MQGQWRNCSNADWLRKSSTYGDIGLLGTAGAYHRGMHVHLALQQSGAGARTTSNMSFCIQPGASPPAPTPAAKPVSHCSLACTTDPPHCGRPHAVPACPPVVEVPSEPAELPCPFVPAKRECCTRTPALLDTLSLAVECRGSDTCFGHACCFSLQTSAI
jgi:hypothetical protein